MGQVMVNRARRSEVGLTWHPSTYKKPIIPLEAPRQPVVHRGSHGGLAPKRLAPTETSSLRTKTAELYQVRQSLHRHSSPRPKPAIPAVDWQVKTRHSTARTCQYQPRSATPALEPPSPAENRRSSTENRRPRQSPPIQRKNRHIMGPGIPNLPGSYLLEREY